MPEIGQTVSHYRILEMIGRGGMGEVYLAEDISLDRKVALKFLPEAFTGDQERMARFEREAKLLASLNHPNIAAIYGLETAEGKRFLVLEYVEGETLLARLSKGALPLEDALAVCRQIAEGLEAAHEKGVIHRDLKPANVMITAEEQVKILDFGLAKALADEIQSVDSSQSPTITEAMTQPGVVLGTAAYMSPEQAKGKSVDKRADIWAFGCILYECLTGKRIFEGETVTETLAAVIKEGPDWNALPATTPQNIRFVLRRCLEKERYRRFRDAADVQIEIEEVREAYEITPSVKHAWLWKSIAAVFIVAFAVVSFLHFRKQPSASTELVRFQLGFRDDVKPGIIGLFALSPDGRHLAFSGVGPDGIQKLWLRSLDSLEAQPLPGTETSLLFQDAFWAPDSRSIAFDSDGKLQKTDIGGGPPRTICNLSGETSGGSWSRDGVIIFGDYSGRNGIMRVPATGGDMEPVTKPDPERQETEHSYPVFLRDGLHFIYHCSSTIAENSGVYLGSINSKPEEQGAKRLIPGPNYASYVPATDSNPGLLLFLRGQTLMAQRFDDKRFELIGEPESVAENVGSILGSNLFSVSANGRLVYRPPSHNEITWIDRSGQELSTIGDPGDYLTFDLSQNEDRLVVTKARPDGTPNLWIVDLLRGPTTRLTLDDASHVDPRWSPDGQKVTFGSPQGASNVLLQVSLQNSKPIQALKLDNGTTFLDDWSHDGSYFLCHDNAEPALWAIPVAGDQKPIEAARSLSGNVDQSQFSPDGRWIAYNANESGQYEVMVVPFPPTGDKWQLSTTGGVQPTWRGDGRELYFLTPKAELMAVDIRAGETFEYGDPHPLFNVQLAVSSGTEQYAPARDGKRFLFVKPSEESAVAPFNVILNWTSLLNK